MGKVLEEQVTQYANLISQIRKLSSVTSSEVICADDYEKKLRDNFLLINELGTESRELVSGVIDPILKKEELLDDDEVTALYVLCEKLLDPFSEEELDLVVLDETSRRLLTDAKEKGNDDDIVHAMYVFINSCYANMIRTNRIRVDANLSRFYSDSGITVAKEMLEYLNEDKFLKISEDSRRYVLIHSRFYLALYDTFYVEESVNKERLSGLWKSYALSENEFYVRLTPKYDWNYHRIRCLENMGQLTERGNTWKMNSDEIQSIYEGVLKLEKIWNENPDVNKKILPKVHLELVSIRNAYFAGKISIDDYENSLMDRYVNWSNNCYDSYSLVGNILVPVEFLSVIDRYSINEEKIVFIEKMYLQMVDYVQHSTNTEAFYFLLDYLISFLEVFVEIPGCITFEEMTLSCLAAINPPTYVHSIQVAQISRCLGRYMYAKNPKLFGGKKLGHVLKYLYHCALCHDFGKLAMLDTIFVYGRALSDIEFSVIKTHPAMSAYMLERYPSAKAYAPVARAHHLWHSKAGGYSLDAKISDEEQIYVDIISIADSIDAATDSVGRNYNCDKSLKEIVDEITDLCPLRYSKEVADLFADEAVINDLLFLINQGRDKNYRNTYLILFKNAGNKE